LDIAHCRLLGQQIAAELSPDSATTPGELVTRMGALQAQDFGGAKWSLGLRLPGTTEADIDQAIADRCIVRTWPMRGTLHFVPAADVRWMLDLLTPRVLAGSTAQWAQLELDDALFERCRTILRKALQGEKILTRDELLRTLDDAGIPTGSQRGYHILCRTAQEGLICFAAPQRKQPTFALLDEWIPPSRRVSYPDRNEALAELARRYFTSHGPATLPDFAWWSGLRAGDAKAGLEGAKAFLEQAAVEGKTYWMPPGLQDLLSDLRSRPPTLFLLPGFDEYLLGYKDRSAALDPRHARTIVPGNNGVFMPTMVSNGAVVGTWKRTATRSRATVTAYPFAPLRDDQEQAFAAATQRYRQFLEGERTESLEP
jgi:hypothetical protein